MRHRLTHLFLVFFGCVTFISESVVPSAWQPPASLYPRPFVHADGAHPWIALTFDDGPHAGATEKLLSLLEKEQVPATFFVVGKMAERYPELVRRISDSGHEVSNHTYNHYSMTSLEPHQALDELRRTRLLIRDLTGHDTPYYRPPGGRITPVVQAQALREGYQIVLWSTQTKDVTGATSEQIRDRILSGAHDGAIVLMHSGMPHTMAALPAVIRELRDRGFQFVTVSTLLKSSHQPG